MAASVLSLFSFLFSSGIFFVTLWLAKGAWMIDSRKPSIQATVEDRRHVLIPLDLRGCLKRSFSCRLRQEAGYTNYRRSTTHFDTTCSTRLPGAILSPSTSGSGLIFHYQPATQYPWKRTHCSKHEVENAGFSDRLSARCLGPPNTVYLPWLWIKWKLQTRLVRWIRTDNGWDVQLCRQHRKRSNTIAKTVVLFIKLLWKLVRSTTKTWNGSVNAVLRKLIWLQNLSLLLLFCYYCCCCCCWGNL